MAWGGVWAPPRPLNEKRVSKKSKNRFISAERSVPPSEDHLDQDKVNKLRRNKKKRLPHEADCPEGEITPCTPTAFVGFFKPAADQAPNPEGQITMTNPGAFLDFFEPPRWIRDCPAPREQVYSPPIRDSGGFVRRKKRRYKRRGYKPRRGWYCEKAGLRARRRRVENFLNYSPEELEQIKRIAERRKRKAEAKYESMYRSYTKGLESKKGHVLRTMADLINIVGERYVTKHALLYEKWRAQVYEHIQRQIEHELGGMSPDYIKDKLRWYQYQYCAIANKQLILRDFPRPDYDPFEPLNYTIKYSTKELADPVKHDLIKENTEKRFLGENVSETAVTRYTMGLQFFPAYHFRGTLWGHIEADEEDGSEIIIKQPEKFYSHDLLYNHKFAGHENVKAEFPRGRQIDPNKGILPETYKFRDRPQGKAMVWDVECQTQPKLRLAYH